MIELGEMRYLLSRCKQTIWEPAYRRLNQLNTNPVCTNLSVCRGANGMNGIQLKGIRQEDAAGAAGEAAQSLRKARRDQSSP